MLPLPPTPEVLALEAVVQRVERPAPWLPGGRVVWRQCGTGPELLLLHGGHGSWKHWARNLQALAQRFTVMALDLPGYGHSSPPPSTTLDAMVDALVHTLPDPTAGRRHLAGFSFGGLVAAALAARLQALGRAPASLTLIGAAGHGGARRPVGELLPWRPHWDAGDATALERTMRHNLAVHMLHSAQRIDATALHIHTEACVATRFHSKSLSRSNELLLALQGFDGPVQCLWGAEDVTATPATLLPALLAQRGAVGAAGQARAEVLAQAGHWVAFEAAEAVNHWLLEALP